MRKLRIVFSSVRNLSLLTGMTALLCAAPAAIATGTTIAAIPADTATGTINSPATTTAAAVGHAGFTASSVQVESAALDQLAATGSRASVAVSADFDRDGKPDLAAGFSGADGSRLAFYLSSPLPSAPGGSTGRATARGPVDAVAPGPVRLNGSFWTRIVTVPSPDRPDFLGAGDFDADGRTDLVVASRDSRALWVLSGDGRGGFAAPRRIDLPGAPTALTVGEIDRADGLPDVVVAVQDGDHASLLVFESPLGALRGGFARLDLPAAATSLALGQFDGDYEMDLAVGSGRALLIVRGEDRRLTSGEPEAPWRPTVSRIDMPSTIVSLAGGRFGETSSRFDRIAALTSDGDLRIVGTVETPEGSSPAVLGSVPAALAQAAAADAGAGAIAPSIASSNGGLILLAPATKTLRTVAFQITANATAAGGARAWASGALSAGNPAQESAAAGEDRRATSRTNQDLAAAVTDGQATGAARQESKTAATYMQATNVLLQESTAAVVSLGATSEPVPGLPGSDAPLAALPVRLNGDGLDDLVVFTGGSASPTVLLLSPSVTFTVNSLADTDDGACDATNCTLREAINAANSSAGADTIDFASFGGSPTIALTSALPTITSPVTIIGESAGGLHLELNGAGAGGASNGFYLGAGSSGSTISGFVINRFGAAGIRIESANDIVKNCWIGTDSTGTGTVSGNLGGGVVISGAAATGILIGGPSPSSRNVISHNSVNGVKIDTGASSNQVQGNYIGTSSTGSSGLGNTNDGVNITGASQNNTIGGSPGNPGQPPGNVISSNSGDGVDINGSGTNGNIVSGNLIGLNFAGSSGLGNLQNGVFLQSAAKSNTIGGTTNAQRNVIAGGVLGLCDGVEVNGTGTDSNSIFGNYIGTDITGLSYISFAEHGVFVQIGALNTAIGAPTSTPGQTGGNVISGNSTDGIRITSITTSGTRIQGNIIGLWADGTAALANTGNGITLQNTSGATIGGFAPTSRNVISGNGPSTASQGIDINGTGSSNNTVAGNYIGLDINGTTARGNGGNGVRISSSTASATGNTIGGLASGPGKAPGNVISGNGLDGVLLTGSGAVRNTVAGNIIGLDASGGAAIKNFGNGVQIGSSAANNTIGGSSVGSRNVISGNNSSSATDGIDINGTGTTGNVVSGNFIGTNAAGTAAVGNGGNGVVIQSNAQNNTVGGNTTTPGTAPGNVISGNDVNTGSDGVELSGASTTGNTVSGNAIGTSADGTGSVPNRNNGVLITNSANGNTIGGINAGDGNLISGNSSSTASAGVQILGSPNNRISGNLIGTNVSGMGAVPNGGDGVLIGDAPPVTGSTGNLVGGTTVGERNVISGNAGNGVRLTGAFSSSNNVTGNYIGLRKDGTYGLGNGANGVLVASGSSPHTIGGVGVTPGTCSGPCNRIGSNAQAGVYIDTSSRITIRGNGIARNGGLGIDLNPAGPTPNDVGDGDTGPNNLQNFPVIVSQTWNGSTSVISGKLNSSPGTNFTIELFSNLSGVDPTGYGEGELFIGSTTCTTNGTGDCNWSVTVAGAQPYVSGTATDPNGNTSEFSLTRTDGDGDGVLDAGDCAPFDAGAYAIPGEVAAQVFLANKQTQTWTSVIPTSGLASVHDVMRGALGQWPVGSGIGEMCLAPGIATNSTNDATVPPGGKGVYYLVRGRNVCGAGTYGTRSDGTPRVTTACP